MPPNRQGMVCFTTYFEVKHYNLCWHNLPTAGISVNLSIGEDKRPFWATTFYGMVKCGNSMRCATRLRLLSQWFENLWYEAVDRVAGQQPRVLIAWMGAVIVPLIQKGWKKLRWI